MISTKNKNKKFQCKKKKTGTTYPPSIKINVDVYTLWGKAEKIYVLYTHVNINNYGHQKNRTRLYF